MVCTKTLTYFHRGLACKGFLAHKWPSRKKRPLVLVVHAWFGQNDFARKTAISLAKLGYTAFAVDMFGEGKVAANSEEAKQLTAPLVEDRHLVRDRLLGALDFAKSLKPSDHTRTAAIGFCFGGMCVIELAKSGASLQGIVSFHAILGNPYQFPIKPVAAASSIPTPILILHGYQDPLVTPEELASFQKELTDKQADWQMIVYGQAAHAFTNPEANETELGLIYNENVAKRSWEEMKLFFCQVL